MYLEYPRGSDMQVVTPFGGRSSVSLSFVEQARYQNRRVREVHDLMAIDALTNSNGCIPYDDIVLTEIPEDVTPDNAMWERALRHLIDVAPDSVVSKVLPQPQPEAATPKPKAKRGPGRPGKTTTK